MLRRALAAPKVPRPAAIRSTSLLNVFSDGNSTASSGKKSLSFRLVRRRNCVLGMFDSSVKVKSRSLWTFAPPPSAWAGGGSCRHAGHLLLAGARCSVFKPAHVQVDPAGEPLLALLDAQRCHEPQAGFWVREDPHDSRTALQFLVEALQAVGAADTTPV